jgi:hypothetical protein
VTWVEKGVRDVVRGGGALGDFEEAEKTSKTPVA